MGMFSTLDVLCKQSHKACACQSRDEETIFKTLVRKVEDVTRKEDVMDIFEILSGKKDLKTATSYVPENLKHLCKENNDGWTRTRHLQMFTKAYTHSINGGALGKSGPNSARTRLVSPWSVSLNQIGESSRLFSI